MRLSRLAVIGPLALGLAVLPACGKAGDTGADGGADVDAGSTVDAGPDANCATTATTRHHSYVPCSEHPTSASRLIVMGDSISYGYGTTNPANVDDTPYTSLAYFNLLLNNGNDNNMEWPTETNTTISAEFNDSSITLVNVAVPGATTASMIASPDQRANLDTALLTGGATSVSGHSIAVITIGGNDLVSEIEGDILDYNAATNAQDLQNGISNIQQVIAYLQDSSKFPDGVSIYLANVYDPSGGTGMLPAQCAESIFGVDEAIDDTYAEGELTDWANAYVSLGTMMGFAVVDARGGFMTHGVTASSTYFYTDCIHPNNTGHNELRRLFFESISGTYIATDN